MLTQPVVQGLPSPPNQAQRAPSPLTRSTVPDTRLARVAGLLYLAVAVLGGFGQLFVRPSVVVPGDAAATAANITASSTLFRAGLAADLVSITLFLVLALVLYRLLSPIDTKAAAAMVAFNAVAVAIMGLNLVNHAGAYLVATSSGYSTLLGADAAAAQVMLFLDLHGLGYLIAEIFFGLWLLPLGYLVFRSGFLPKALGVLLTVGAASYLGDVVVSLLVPGASEALSLLLAAPAAVAELAFLTWLSVMGTKPTRRNERPATIVLSGSPAHD